MAKVHPHKVLIVDDSPPIRQFMSECLQQLGFNNLSEATNGAEALASVIESMPDLITLDWNMPRMDGLTFLKNLRRLTGGNEPIVVFCSTEGSSRKIAEVMAAGANEYITKPFDVHIVRETLESLGVI